MSKYNAKLQFSDTVKEKVYERARGRCELCGSFYPVDFHHILLKKQLGKGIEQNCILLCRECHDKIHSKVRGVTRWEMEEKANKYLSDFYPKEELTNEFRRYSKWSDMSE